LDLQGAPRAGANRFAVVVSRFNAEVTDGLLAGALSALDAAGVTADARTIVRVPGAFELPAAARAALSEPKRPDALIVLGAIVKGETTHHDVLGHAVAGALASLSAETGQPIGFGLLTCDTMDQARKRSGKGAEAAEAAIAMANLKRRRARG